VSAPLATLPLGRTGLFVSAQGLGCMGMSHAYGPADAAQSRAVLRRALDLGISFWDTADVYGQGENERLLAPLLRAARESIVIATKFGLAVPASGGEPGARRVRGDPTYVHAACDASLARLGIECIDLYYQHRVDVTVPIEETVGAMAELVRAGKVRHLGLSEVTAQELKRAHAVHPIAAVQSEWSLWSRDVKDSVVPTCRELGVGFVPYSPLGRGFLTGRLPAIHTLSEQDFRRVQPRLQTEVIEHNRALVREIEHIAAARGVSAACVALAWVHARLLQWQLPVVPIPGTRQITRLEENLGALDFSFTREELNLLDGLAARVRGVRHPHMDLTSAGPRD